MHLALFTTSRYGSIRIFVDTDYFIGCAKNESPVQRWCANGVKLGEKCFSSALKEKIDFR